MLASRSARATGIGCVAILSWAGFALLTVQARGIPPFQMLALTFAVACVAGLVVLGVRGRRGLSELVQPAAPWWTAFGAIFGYHALYFYALQAAPPAYASLINYLWPLGIVLMSGLAPGGERLRPRHLIGATMGFGGTALLLVGGDGTAQPGSWSGYAAAFGCAILWSGYSVANRRFAMVPSGMLVGVCGAVAAAGALCHLLFEPATARPTPLQWAVIAGIGIGPTGLAFLAWDHATKHGNLPLLGGLSYLAPPVSTLLLVVAGFAATSATLGGATALVVGGALVAAGVLPPRRRATPGTVAPPRFPA